VRIIAADTIALVLFNCSMGVFNFFVERYFVGYHMAQWAGIHLLYNIAKYAGAGICGWMKRRLRRALGATAPSATKKGRVWCAAVDTVALACYQIPLYIVFAFLFGAEWSQIRLAVYYAIAEHIIGGWWYGVLSDWCAHRYVNHKPASTEAVVLKPAACD
jgi:hypothetical protein